jgi:hypothetical protein
VTPVELRGPVQADDGPHRLQVRAEGARAQALVGALDLLDGLGVPPDHEVGVGAQAAHVVPAAHDEVVVRGDGGERVLDGGAARRVVGRQRGGGREDRPHRVADGRVEGLVVRTGGRGRGAHACGSSEQAAGRPLSTPS